MKNLTRNILSATLLGLATAAGAQDATFSSFKYQGCDSRFSEQIDPHNQYYNPILAGFYPDPSVCRVKDSYYLVNSSFAFFPGVPLFKSNDLVNWRQVGSVLDRNSQLDLSHQKTSGGIFAPAISYNKSNKTFYMITTNVAKGNFVVKTQDPEKGWSEPIFLPKIDGIDPSLFFDDKGNGWIVHNAPVMGEAAYEGQRAIRLLRYDVKGDSTVGNPIEIVRGGTHVDEHPIWIEGPHLYKRGGYYYLMCAEGGTGFRHSEVVFRSKNLTKGWQECPYNPILTQRSGIDENRKNPVSSTGHADLVEAKDGSWWAVFLGCRPYEGDYYNTGRDTYLLPVTWKGGWPIILEKGRVLPNIVRKTDLQPLTPIDVQLTGNFSYTDNFDSPRLGTRWMFLRNPAPNAYSTGQGLILHPLAYNLSQKEPLSAVFCRQQHTSFSAETTLTFEPRSSKELAGMALLQNESHYFILGKTLREGTPVITLTRCDDAPSLIASALLTSKDSHEPIRLKVEGNGRYYSFFFAVGNGTWQTLATGVDASNLSTKKSGGFIGTCIGLYATSNN